MKPGSSLAIDESVDACYKCRKFGNTHGRGESMRPQARYPEVYTVAEFAKVFKVSPEAVRGLIRQGEIPAIRIGKQYRIPENVVSWLFSQATAAEARGFAMWRQKPADTDIFLIPPSAPWRPPSLLVFALWPPSLPAC